jgi:hypothetical protein
MGLDAFCWPDGRKWPDACQNQIVVAFLVRYVTQGRMQEDGSNGPWR